MQDAIRLIQFLGFSFTVFMSSVKRYINFEIDREEPTKKNAQNTSTT